MSSSDWYASLVYQECEDVQDTQAQDGLATLLRGLRAVCPAVAPEGQADWKVAESAYYALSSSGGLADTGCEEGNGYLLLEQLVTLHREHPDARFHVATGDNGTFGRC
ncbi:hypothetical protein ABZ848_05605 [Streptomyces sp. NPDC047081]|uniref:hypothetical protein n=1 Tax=Streptomyces sp. NPDC047081 TaxID=3154706 RepID=UPI0033CC1BD1